MYNHRARILLALIATAFVGVSGRLAYLQVVQGEYWISKAEELLQDSELLPVIRGNILDRRGNVLAMDQPCFDLCLHYQFLTSDPQWIKRQQRKIQTDEGVRAEQAAELFKQRQTSAWALAWHLADQKDVNLSQTIQRIVSRIRAMRELAGTPRLEEQTYHPVVSGLEEAVDLSGTVGVTLQPSRRRWYPRNDTASHILGFTGLASEDDQKRFNLSAGEADRLTRLRNNYLPGDSIGKAGVERMCEALLRGRRGYRQFKVEAGERNILEELPPEHGQDVHLALDAELQEQIARLMPDQQRLGSIVVLSVDSGEVLAMVSLPTYDLNSYFHDYSALVADEANLPLMHRAIRGLYPPGSTAKALAALAGLETGVIAPGTQFDCPGFLPSVRSLHCWIGKQNGSHGTLDLVGGLKNSCNVYFYHVGALLGPDRLCDWFGRFGFGDKPGTGLPEEMPGVVPSTESMKRTKGRGFYPAEPMMMAIGQGPVSVTPLHVANAMATIARDGRFLSPRLVLPTSGDGPSAAKAAEALPAQLARDLHIAPGHLRAVQEGMHKVINERGGTAYSVFHGTGFEPLNVDVCGKTGTAQAEPRRVKGQVVREGDMAWFAGFAPYRDPKIAFAVLVEYVEPGGSGSHTAAPIAREVVRLCQAMGYVN